MDPFAGYKTAIYLKASGLATIENPTDMTPSEFNTVVNFLIEKKKEGQFRAIWEDYGQCVNLLASGEVWLAGRKPDQAPNFFSSIARGDVFRRLDK